MSETENIIPTAIKESDLRGDSSLPSGSDLEGSALPTDTTVGRSDPIVAHKKFPLFSVILLLILSVVSVIAVYLFLQVRELSINQPVPSPSPTPAASTDPTEGWVTYTNEKYKFSFSYPQSMNSVTENEDFANGDFKGIVIVQNFPRTNTPNYSENATFQMLIYAKKDDGNIKDQKELTPYGGDGATIAKVINGYVYHINFTRNKTGNAKLPDQILSTFKFTGEAEQSPSPKPTKVKILDASNWQESTCNLISYKIPPGYNQICDSSADGTSDTIISKEGEFGNSANIFVRKYDGGSRRQYWISTMKASTSEVSKYMRFQESIFGNVTGLDVFASVGWWQGGYASPILIAKDTTIVVIHGGRGFNDQNGEITRWDITDTIASTIKFN